MTSARSERSMVEVLAPDLMGIGGVDMSECFIDGSLCMAENSGANAKDGKWSATLPGFITLEEHWSNMTTKLKTTRPLSC